MEHSFDHPQAAQNFALITQILEALTPEGVSTISQFFTDDIYLRLPFQSPLFWGGADGIADARRFFGSLAVLFVDLRVEPTAVIETTDPDCLVVEYVGHGTSRDGRSYDNEYIAVCRFRDGLLQRWVEYHNPIRLLEALGPS